MNLNNRQNKPRVSLSTDKLPVARKKENELSGAADDSNGCTNRVEVTSRPKPSPPQQRNGMFRSRPRGVSSTVSSTSAFIDDEESFLRTLHLLNLAVSEQNGQPLSSSSSSKLVSKVRRETHTARLVSLQPLFIQVFVDGILLEDRNGEDIEQLVLSELTASAAKGECRWVHRRRGSAEGITSQYFSYGSEFRTRLLNDLSQGFLPFFLASAYENGVKLEGKWSNEMTCPTAESLPLEEARKTTTGHRLGGSVRDARERIFHTAAVPSASESTPDTAHERSQVKLSSSVHGQQPTKEIQLLTPKGRLVLHLNSNHWHQRVGEGEQQALPATATHDDLLEWLSGSITRERKWSLYVVGGDEWRVSGPIKEAVRGGIVLRCVPV